MTLLLCLCDVVVVSDGDGRQHYPGACVGSLPP